MEGAVIAGSYPERAKAALTAGCDMVLVCNQPQAASDVVTSLDPEWVNPDSSRRLATMKKQITMDWSALQAFQPYVEALQLLDTWKRQQH